MTYHWQNHYVYKFGLKVYTVVTRYIPMNILTKLGIYKV